MADFAFNATACDACACMSVRWCFCVHVGDLMAVCLHDVHSWLRVRVGWRSATCPCVFQRRVPTGHCWSQAQVCASVLFSLDVLYFCDLWLQLLLALHVDGFPWEFEALNFQWFDSGANRTICF